MFIPESRVVKYDFIQMRSQILNSTIGANIDEGDPCKQYQDGQSVCQHDNFPSKSIGDIYGKDVLTCCRAHGYIFIDDCEVRFLFF